MIDVRLEHNIDPLLSLVASHRGWWDACKTEVVRILEHERLVRLEEALCNSREALAEHLGTVAHYRATAMRMLTDARQRMDGEFCIINAETLPAHALWLVEHRELLGAHSFACTTVALQRSVACGLQLRGFDAESASRIAECLVRAQ